MKSPTIQFVNHASVIISYNKISILSDPWFSDTAFHNGWRLMHELKDDEAIDILNKTTHIYISHEHPDHFRPTFFQDNKIKNIIIDRKIEFLFQNTKDKRIVKFLEKQGFKVIEIKSNEKVKLDNDVEVQIVRSGFYDSLLIIKTPDAKILNMNDCPIRNQNELSNFRKRYGTFDTLLTQFSYAAWKGGANNKNYRKIAADEKLEDVYRQANFLNCKTVIPFASFIYFSNELNFYMNDSINEPEHVIKFFSDKKTNIVFMSPGEIQRINSLEQKQSALNFWKEKYNDISTKYSKQKDKYVDSISLEDLKNYFNNYQKKIFKKNSKLLIFILSKIKLLNFFQPLKIKLLDHNKIYKFSVFNGLTEDINIKQCDISMHSQSLSFIFKNEFGFDTLTVNGCFEANQTGFEKVTKTLALGNLNAIGFNLNLGLIFHSDIIFLFLKTLKKVKKNLMFYKNN